MSYRTFPSIFYSKEPLPTTTTLFFAPGGNSDNPKISWSTCVIDTEENNEDTNSKQNTLTPYYDNDEGLIDCCEIEDNYEIFPTKSGKFKTIFHVPSALIPVIVGPKGVKLRELQERTQTLIKVPRIHEVGMPVKVTGHSERSVASARNQITLLVLTKREKLQSTHFISIPVQSHTIIKNFEKFKKEILNGPAVRGIEESIFQNSLKLHMTIEVLTLLDESEIEHAKNLLVENILIIFSDIECGFILKGVEIMNDDPNEVDVLYAKVQMNDEEFQEAVNGLSNLFYMNGYVRRKFENVRLHVTLMNTLFRKDGEEKRSTFDASFILKKYQNYFFGDAFVNTIDLSIRFSTGDNGYYNSVVSIPLYS